MTRLLALQIFPKVRYYGAFVSYGVALWSSALDQAEDRRKPFVYWGVHQRNSELQDI